MPACWRCLSIVVSGAMLLACVNASAQTFPSPAPTAAGRIVEFSQLPKSGPKRIAIVGDVTRPGVYETTSAATVAADLISRAGVEPRNGDAFRRFHGGLRPVDAQAWTADRERLFHGDVVVYLRRRTPAIVHQPQPGPIHVAVIGIANDPVVVRLNDSERTLRSLVAALKQAPDVAVTATVNGVPSPLSLKNGDVIFLDSSLIDRTSLAGCSSILQAMPLDDKTPAAVTADPPVELPPEPQPDVASRDVEPSWALSLPPAVLTATDEPANDNQSATLPTPLAGRESDNAGMRPVLSAPEPAVTRRATEKLQTAATEHDVSTPAADSALQTLVLLVALGTLGLGVALLWLASERRTRSTELLTTLVEPVDSAVEEVEPESDLFNELLHGQLPVEDEPVVLPAQLSLHGDAVGHRRLILHPPQALAGPHFASTAAARESKPATVAVGESPARPAKPAVTVNTPVRSARDTEGLLDRVLLAMQREGRP